VISDLPMQSKIPDHIVRLKSGELFHGRSCPGGKVTETEEDVGLVTAKCPSCNQYFVYNFKSDTWVKEEDFEQNLKDHPPKIASL
jgi:hypothetical protein